MFGQSSRLLSKRLCVATPHAAPSSRAFSLHRSQSALNGSDFASESNASQGVKRSNKTNALRSMIKGAIQREISCSGLRKATRLENSSDIRDHQHMHCHHQSPIQPQQHDFSRNPWVHTNCLTSNSISTHVYDVAIHDHPLPISTSIDLNHLVFNRPQPSLNPPSLSSPHSTASNIHRHNTLFAPKQSFTRLSSSYQLHNHLYLNSSQISSEPKRSFAMTNNPRETISIGLCQIDVGPEKAVNLESARNSVFKAHAEGARLVILPECFNCPYGNSFFNAYAETIPDAPCTNLDMLKKSKSPTVAQASEWSKDLGIYLIAGSIPERDSEGKLYNTSMVFNPEGHLIAKHRKLHLFDIDIPGKITFIESETLSAGKSITTFELDPSLIRSPIIREQSDEETKQQGGVRVPATTPFTVGLGICYDIRFPEYAQICTNRGAKLLAYPGAFNTITGPAHWELLQRARAVDNQLVRLITQSKDDDHDI